MCGAQEIVVALLLRKLKTFSEISGIKMKSAYMVLLDTATIDCWIARIQKKVRNNVRLKAV